MQDISQYAELKRLYAGELNPTDAWEILANEHNSYLIDVRTLPEWSFVGVPDLSSIDKDVIKISWLIYPTMEVNANFLEELSSEVPELDAKLIFLCKVGGRSKEAAILATNYGYKNCFNLSEGFEGAIDSNGHRGLINGWKAVNLPWEQF